MGRKKTVITGKQLDKIADCCEIGLTDEEIARVLNVSPRTLSTLRGRDEHLDNILSRKKYTGRYYKQDAGYWGRMKKQLSILRNE